MQKINQHIEIVRSTGRGLSSMSKSSCNAILAVLARHYAKVGVTIINNLADFESVVALKPDLVFLGMKFVPNDSALGLEDPAKIWISSYLDENNIAYTGSGQSAHQFGVNKPLAKQRILDATLNTPAFYVIEQNQPSFERNLPLKFPLFVKPTSRGSGLGIDSHSLVNNYGELKAKVLSIARSLKSDSLIETYLPGREFSVAILGSEYPGQFSVMPIELVAPPNEQGFRLLSKQVKSSNTERALEVTDETIKAKISSLALKAFNALGARDYGRIDIRLDKTGRPQFLEANLMPNLISGYGSFPKACVLNLGLDFEPMILRIVKLALTRNLQAAEPEPLASTALLPTY